MAGLPKKYIKKYGITKKAWREYRKDKPRASGSTKASPRGTPKRSRKTPKKKKGGGGKKLFGQFGPVGLITAGLMLAAAKFGIRRYAPQAGSYTSAVGAIAAGGAAKALNISGKSMFGLGLVELISELATDIMLPGGMVTGPWVPAAQQNGNRGYMF